MTVMFCDLVGSTALSARLDPEDLCDVMRDFHRACADCIAAAGGYVAKELGDGALAYFGFPEGHEDAAERAVRAALDVIGAAGAISVGGGDERLKARVGIATGLVVVRGVTTGRADEPEVIGKTPNLAARLQATAEPGGIVVSALTHRLTAGLFEYRSLGWVALKGLPAPEPAWSVVAPAADGQRRAPSSSSTPLVGRDATLDRLLALWRSCAAGQGKLIGVVGEAGIGKSRLVREIRGRIAAEPHLWLEGAGAQVFANSPFYAVGRMIRRSLAGGRAQLTADGFLARLQRSLAAAGVEDERALALVAELIGVPTLEHPALLTLAPDERRRALIATLEEWLLKSSKRQPVFMVVEDLHWVDPSTLEFLERIAPNLATASLCLLYTARDVSTAPAVPHTLIPLERLDAPSIQSIAAAANGALTENALSRIVERADGVPLFAEEIARFLAEAGPDAAGHDVPATLADLLTARLDLLGDAKRLLQVAAVLGQAFSERLLKAVAGVGQRELRAALTHLTASRALLPDDSRSGRAYAFGHALLRDAAYSALLRRERAELHRRAAVVLTEQFPNVAAARPEVVAQHWEGAGDSEKAIDAWTKAAKVASARHAYKEAEVAYRQALVGLSQRPESPERDALELGLQSSFVGVLQITLGYSAPDTDNATRRARALAEKGGDLRKQFSNVAAAWMAASSAGDYSTASPFAEQLLPLARGLGTPRALGVAHMALLTARGHVGDFIGAEEAFLNGKPYFASPEFSRLPGSVAQTYGNAAINAWTMGAFGEARTRIGHVLTACRTSKDPYDLAFSEFMAGMHALIMGDLEESERLARRAIARSTDHGFPQFLATSSIILGRTRAELGHPAEGLALILAGLKGMDGTRNRSGFTLYLTWLAATHALCGSIDRALQVVEEALTSNPLERDFRAESLRLRGELRLAAGDRQGALADVHSAIDLAAAIGAGYFHKRATATLEIIKASKAGLGKVKSNDQPLGRAVL